MRRRGRRGTGRVLRRRRPRRAAGPGAVRRGRVPSLGVARRPAGPARPAGVRPRPGRGDWLGAGDRGGAARCASGCARSRLESFARTTGGKGLHVVVPIERRHGWPAAKRFAAGMARAMAADSPQPLHGQARQGGARGAGSSSTTCATSTAPPPSRPTRCARGPGRRIAMPVAWARSTAALDPGRFTLGDRAGPAWPARATRGPGWRSCASAYRACGTAAEARAFTEFASAAHACFRLARTPPRRRRLHVAAARGGLAGAAPGASC